MGIRNIVEEKSPWFMREVNQHLMEGATKKPTVGHFRPSDFVELPENTCFRELFYTYIGLAPSAEFDLSSMRRMLAGTAHHNMWEDVFKEAIPSTQSGELFEIRGDEVFVFNRKKRMYELYRTDKDADYPYIRGRCDWCVAKDGSSEWELIEWKSGAYKKPKDAHIVQWNLYSIMLNIRKGWIILENRSDVVPQPFPIERDNNLIDKLFMGLRKVETYAKENKVIEKDERCLNGIWKPKYCEVNELCFSERGDNPWT